jgi:molybdopterin-guanine dinucleotide biosynthesis protein A
LLARIVAILDPAEIGISANGDLARFAAFGREGPLAGVLAGFDWAFSIGATALQTVLGDTAFVPPGLAATCRRRQSVP